MITLATDHPGQISSLIKIIIKNSTWKTDTTADIMLDNFKQLLRMFLRNNILYKILFDQEIHLKSFIHKSIKSTPEKSTPQTIILKAVAISAMSLSNIFLFKLQSQFINYMKTLLHILPNLIFL